MTVFFWTLGVLAYPTVFYFVFRAVLRYMMRDGLGLDLTDILIAFMLAIFLPVGLLCVARWSLLDVEGSLAAKLEKWAEKK